MYTDQISKTNNGGLKLDNECVVGYENVQKPNRCVVNVFKKYISHCPSYTKNDAF